MHDKKPKLLLMHKNSLCSVLINEGRKIDVKNLSAKEKVEK